MNSDKSVLADQPLPDGDGGVAGRDVGGAPVRGRILPRVPIRAGSDPIGRGGEAPPAARLARSAEAVVRGVRVGGEVRPRREPGAYARGGAGRRLVEAVVVVVEW